MPLLVQQVKLGPTFVQLPACGLDVGRQLIHPACFGVQPLLPVGHSRLAPLEVAPQLPDLGRDRSDLLVQVTANFGGLLRGLLGPTHDRGGLGFGGGERSRTSASGTSGSSTSGSNTSGRDTSGSNTAGSSRTLLHELALSQIGGQASISRLL